VRLITAHPATDEGPVHVVRLRHLNEVAEVVRVLEDGSPVVVDLAELDAEIRQRAFDTMSGVAYAFDATVVRVGGHRLQFVVTPTLS
jgi:FtsZ-interacting cell division protein YlmF